MFKKIEDEIKNCTRCCLYKDRKNVVIGNGNVSADLMFVGEAPGRQEDLTGEPFCGRSGKLLSKMIIAMGYTRKDVYIANVIKCRPPNNRNPLPYEIEKCKDFLSRQIQHINPKVIVTLGNFAMKELRQCKDNLGITKSHGKIFVIDLFYHPNKMIFVVPTFHPAYLLRNSNRKRECWEDLQVAMEILKQ